MRILSFLRWSIVGALLALLIAPAAITLATGTQLVVVDGKSMTPTYEFGDLVLIGDPHPDDFQPGRVVTVGRPDGSMYTHRIQEITDGKALLKGDGNTAADPDTISYDQLVGAVRGHIGGPLAAVLAYVQTTPARISLAVLVLALLLLPLERRPADAKDGEDGEDGGREDGDTDPADQKDPPATSAEDTDRVLGDVFGLAGDRHPRTEKPSFLAPQEQNGPIRRRSPQW
ncbi:signal peptidase I [Microbacterium sp. 20-116]|uniref:signal peptidase I n=1 Tax=Microbacterium sp. 20-116 TaxID=3239883 RepID=UPI0034E2183B